ncbi:transmembrane protein 44 isoform X2 [Xenopus laevis]|uniref:Transmembrane protein 44 isoform X2 n=2 Tax=Xenopus laevis TaxID=8355 RepID=A0A1L8GAD6_XENLA|nr:transmembrane protein 44 isoform X2 [Xenopus laevis]OCT80711.1 hypothetical protein XELAEV_18027525mg [Xenopus laevis]
MIGRRNGTGDSAVGRAGVWSWDYLITCFAQEKVCVSFVLWLLSCLFWLTSCSIQFNLRCTRKSSHEATVFWNIYRFFGSMCNTIGALLSQQLAIQVITGFYMAIADVVHFLLTLYPACTYKDRPRSSCRSRTRKKSILSALSVTLFAVVGCNLLNAHNYVSYDVSYVPQRRLLESALQERTDIVGFTLGIIAVIVTWTARVPLITKVCKGKVFPVLHIWAILFSSLASVMYAVSVMSHDRRPEYFIRAIPWFLISLGAAALDVALMFLYCLMKNTFIPPMTLVSMPVDGSDKVELLAQDDDEDEEETDGNHNPAEKRRRKSWTPLNMIPDKGQNIKKALGRYVRLSVEQVQEVGTEEVRLPGDGETNAGTNNEPICYLDLPVYPPDHVTVAQLCSASSSEISSSNNELEWDFDDLDPQWSNNSYISNIHPKDSSVLSTATE